MLRSHIHWALRGFFYLRRVAAGFSDFKKPGDRRGLQYPWAAVRALWNFLSSNHETPVNKLEGVTQDNPYYILVAPYWGWTTYGAPEGFAQTLYDIWTVILEIVCMTYNLKGPKITWHPHKCFRKPERPYSTCMMPFRICLRVNSWQKSSDTLWFFYSELKAPDMPYGEKEQPRHPCGRHKILHFFPRNLAHMDTLSRIGGYVTVALAVIQEQVWMFLTEGTKEGKGERFVCAIFFFEIADMWLVPITYFKFHVWLMILNGLSTIGYHIYTR